jgi:hypothetical protein
MIDGWTPNEESVHLRFGIEYHKALQEYDKLAAAESWTHNEIVHSVVRNLLDRTQDWDPDHRYKNREFLVRTVVWYLDKFEDDPAKVHILEDGKPAVELSFRFELDHGPSLGNQPYLLCGHLDKIVDYSDALFVMDHKTTTRGFSEYYWNQFSPDNQMTLYTLAAKVVINSPVKGVVINAAAIQVGESKFERRFIFRTQDQIEEWLLDLRYVLGEAESCAAAGHWRMNDKACTMCQFRKVCDSDSRIRETLLKSDYHKREEPWNPLTPRD